MVNRSSSPCVGCACRPSPALITCSWGFTWRAIRYGAPEEPWRTTKMSACIADRLATVSRSDSPLVCEDSAMLRLITSAERRLAAISKVVRVRVEGSKNRLNTLLPRSSGTVFTSRSVTPANDSAVSRIRVSTSRGSPSIDSRCCSSPFALSCGLRCTFGLECEGELAVDAALEAQAHARGHFDLRAAMLSADRQLPAAAIGEHHQRERGRPAVVEQLVHRRAHGAAGVENVVHQQQLAAADVERYPGALGVVLEALRVVVVAIEGDVHEPQRSREREHRVQPFGEPGSAGMNPDHRCVRADARLQLGGELRAELFGVRKSAHRNAARGSAAPRPSRSRPCLRAGRAGGFAPPASCSARPRKRPAGGSALRAGARTARRGASSRAPRRLPRAAAPPPAPPAPHPA